MDAGSLFNSCWQKQGLTYGIYRPINNDECWSAQSPLVRIRSEASHHLSCLAGLKRFFLKERQGHSDLNLWTGRALCKLFQIRQSPDHRKRLRDRVLVSQPILLHFSYENPTSSPNSLAQVFSSSGHMVVREKAVLGFGCVPTGCMRLMLIMDDCEQ